ncbi:MAG: GNAT family N-acetyltransferase [Bacteroidaceae bacterium]|nr:GNAT family N-acetyltransferase [Bacteroidaceae bacterium]
MAFITDKCTFHELTDEVLAACQPFSCDNDDLDDFFAHDATRYAHFLMGKTYCFRLSDNPTKIVCALTISNDSIRIYDLPRSRRDYMKSLTHHEKPLRRYSGVLTGRLGVSREFARQGIGSEALQFIKGWFYSSSNKTGCRFIIVDAVNDPKVIAFYKKNGFHTLFSTEEQEFLYTGGKKGQPVTLTTRLMYYDLLEMRK